MRQIAHLYRIEENLRRSQAGPRKRAAVRISQSRPICQRLHRALVLFKKSRRYLPRSAFGQAIDYALSNWPLLVSISKRGASKLTTTSWKTPFGRPLLERRTGCSWAFLKLLLQFVGNRYISGTNCSSKPLSVIDASKPCITVGCRKCFIEEY
jgi:hypothetical protein